MSSRAGDCEYCHAPAPGVGEIEHSRFCPRPPFQHHDAPLPDAQWIDAGMSAKESRAALIALARRIEDGWARRAFKQNYYRERANMPYSLTHENKDGPGRIKIAWEREQ